MKAIIKTGPFMEKAFIFLTPFAMAMAVAAGKYVVITSLFVLADAVTGIVASKKRGEAFSSRRLRDSVGKFISYGVFILVAAGIELTFVKDFPCTKIVAAFVAYIELKSIDENAKDITGHSIFSSIIKLINPKKNDA